MLTPFIPPPHLFSNMRHNEIIQSLSLIIKTRSIKLLYYFEAATLYPPKVRGKSLSTTDNGTLTRGGHADVSAGDHQRNNEEKVTGKHRVQIVSLGKRKRKKRLLIKNLRAQSLLARWCL